MPELAEVEVVRRGLVQEVPEGARVRSVWRSDKPLRTGANWTGEHLELLEGARLLQVHRRGKHLLWRFRGADGLDGVWHIHLGMSGRFGVSRVDAPLVPHTHARLEFERGRELRFVDARRFGGLRCGVWDELMSAPPLCDLGPEPLEPEFDGATLRSCARGSTRAVREVLLDQRVVAGVGNIYVTEALFEAKVHPLVSAASLSLAQWRAVAAAVRCVLLRSIEHGGTTLEDFRNVSGEVGRNQDDLRVYGRAGQACPRCGGTLQGYVHAGRSGVLCPREQRAPR